MLITTSALFGFVELQHRAQIASIEASQRAYAIHIASSIVEQIKANPEIGIDCSFSSSLKVGKDSGSWNYRCPAKEAGQYSIREWHNELLGKGETRNFNSDTVKVCGIKNGRACIDYMPGTPASSSIEGISVKYTLSVAWQGFEKSAEANLIGSCGFGAYGDPGYHRLLSH